MRSLKSTRLSVAKRGLSWLGLSMCLCSITLQTEESRDVLEFCWEILSLTRRVLESSIWLLGSEKTITSSVSRQGLSHLITHQSPSTRTGSSQTKSKTIQDCTSKQLTNRSESISCLLKDSSAINKSLTTILIAGEATHLSCIEPFRPGSSE